MHDPKPEDRRIGWFSLKELCLARAGALQAGRTMATAQLRSLRFLASVSSSVKWGVGVVKMWLRGGVTSAM